MARPVCCLDFRFDLSEDWWIAVRRKIDNHLPKIFCLALCLQNDWNIYRFVRACACCQTCWLASLRARAFFAVGWIYARVFVFFCYRGVHRLALLPLKCSYYALITIKRRPPTACRSSASAHAAGGGSLYKVLLGGKVAFIWLAYLFRQNCAAAQLLPEDIRRASRLREFPYFIKLYLIRPLLSDISIGHKKSTSAFSCIRSYCLIFHFLVHCTKLHWVGIKLNVFRIQV